MHAKTELYKFTEDPASISDKLFQEAQQLIGTKNMLFLDHFGSLDSQRLFNLLEYCAIKTDVIILDHISIAISGNKSSHEGERKDIDILMTKLKELANRTGVSIIAVSHLTRPKGGEAYEEGKAVSLSSFRGSGALTQIPDIVMSLERDTQNDQHKDKTNIRILKNRITGKVGLLGTLYFITETGRLVTPEQLLGN